MVVQHIPDLGAFGADRALFGKEHDYEHLDASIWEEVTMGTYLGRVCVVTLPRSIYVSKGQAGELLQHLPIVSSPRHEFLMVVPFTEKACRIRAQSTGAIRLERARRRV